MGLIDAAQKRVPWYLAISATVIVSGLGMVAASPAASNASTTINEYPVPTASAGLQGITAGPDGNIWFTEQSANGGAGSIGKITPPGAVTEYPLPPRTGGPPVNVPSGIVAGPDGNLWFTEIANGAIGNITPSGAITTYKLPGAGAAAAPSCIAAGSDGDLYFSENGQGGFSLGKITTSGVVTQYSLPTGTGTTCVTPGPDGNIWFAAKVNFSTPKIASTYWGLITPGGAITEYPQPSGSDYTSFTFGPDGNLWAIQGETGNASVGGVAIDKWSPSAGTATGYLVPTANPGLSAITAGPDGSLWFTEKTAGQIGEITTSGTVTEYPLPTANSGPAFITAGPDGNIWFPESTANRIGEYLLAVPPAAPSGLTIPSPATAPALTWTAVPRAASYNVYRDGTVIAATSAATYTDATASPGVHQYDVTAVNSFGESAPSDVAAVTVDVAPSITSAGSAATGMRQPFAFTVTTSGTPAAVTTESGALPAGITFADNGDGTATLAGEAAAGTAGSYPITITASNAVGTAAQSFTLTVDSRTEAPAITSANSDTETVGAPFSFTVTTDGYPVPALTKKGALPKDITVTDNGDGSATISSAGPAASDAGSYALIITAANGVLPQAQQTFTLTITQAPVLKGIPVTKPAHAGVAFSMNITSKANPVASLTESGALPPGLAFSDNGDGTAAISGTPQTGDGGLYPITITATNSLGAVSQTFTLKVLEAPVITSADSAQALSGSPFSFTVTATGYPGPSLKKTGTLPKGVTWQASTGTLSGTPAAGTAGAYPITFTATNSSGSVSQTFTLTVS
jgi:streptogramin lyase